jgi:hypothetical protein
MPATRTGKTGSHLFPSIPKRSTAASVLPMLRMLCAMLSKPDCHQDLQGCYPTSSSILHHPSKIRVVPVQAIWKSMTRALLGSSNVLTSGCPPHCFIPGSGFVRWRTKGLVLPLVFHSRVDFCVVVE